jgi:hypothetical protein
MSKYQKRPEDWEVDVLPLWKRLIIVYRLAKSVVVVKIP